MSAGQPDAGRTGHGRGDRGAAAVVAVALVGVLAVVGYGLALVAGVVVAQRRVETAADLGALAGAGALAQGAAGCAAAGPVVARNGAEVASCTEEGRDVLLVASGRAPGPLGRWVTLTARARAGPG
ncbi:Rv3654c family TadE-like protein [Nocardioides sp. GY 10127]|uniref:Rv3654c family TadE-like protein n=1 Tax=Nocardioides sp. GY 10127 TaxID=2569762 RepID=UPI0010A8A471|nr:Rv3654c family TadE-like protein [Nocardioides sp. GY 10127]TIC78576.1 pilus assembly protein TadE [Nocardioides sp. GY 10127]